METLGGAAFGLLAIAVVVLRIWLAVKVSRRSGSGRSFQDWYNDGVHPCPECARTMMGRTRRCPFCGRQQPRYEN